MNLFRGMIDSLWYHRRKCIYKFLPSTSRSNAFIHINSNLNCIRITYTPAPLFFYTLMFPTVYILKKKTFVEWRKNVKNLWKFQVHKFKPNYKFSLKNIHAVIPKKLLRAKSCLQTDGQSESNNLSPNFVCGIIALLFLYR